MNHVDIDHHGQYSRLTVMDQNRSMKLDICFFLTYHIVKYNNTIRHDNDKRILLYNRFSCQGF